MAIQIQGNGGTVAEVDGTNFRAQRVTIRPTDYGTAGHFSYGGLSGIIPAAASANAELFQFRWNEATRICLINEVLISASVTTTFFAAGVPMQLDMVKATTWSAAGSGGTRPTITSLMKKRSSMASSLVNASDIGIITTVGTGLVAGTKALEATSLSTVIAGCPITASLNGSIIAPGTPIWHVDTANGQHPLALVNQEGFVIRAVAVPGTGTWMLSVTVDWTEVDAY